MATLWSTLAEIKHLDLAKCLTNRNDKLSNWGGYGDITTGNCELPGRGSVKVAIKRIRVHALHEKEVDKFIGGEIRVWYNLKHPNILPLLGYIIDGNDFPCFISEYMDNGTILRYIQLHPDCDLVYMIIGIAEGVSYLHKNRVIHSDLKSDNVLVSNYGKPLICDFGVSRMITVSQSLSRAGRSTSTNVKGSTRWMSPELIDSVDGHYLSQSKSSDVWAFGMTVYELLTKKRPYYRCKTDLQALMAIVKGELPDKPGSFQAWSVQYIDLWEVCEACWSRDPTKRPRLRDINTKLKEMAMKIVSQVPDETTVLPTDLENFNRNDTLRALLSSETLYLHELVLIRDVVIPLANGSRETPCSSEIIPPSKNTTLPMTEDDVRIIFGNILDLATFSEICEKMICKEIGDISGPANTDSNIGRVLAELVPQMGRLYKKYILNHTTALQHLGSLVQTPELNAFLVQVQLHIVSVSNAWDLPSLLLRPLQQPLKYYKLLAIIIDQTPGDTGDRKHLTQAYRMIEAFIQSFKDTSHSANQYVNKLKSPSMAPPSQTSLSAHQRPPPPPRSSLRPSPRSVSPIATLPDLDNQQGVSAVLHTDNLNKTTNIDASVKSITGSEEESSASESFIPDNLVAPEAKLLSVHPDANSPRSSQGPDIERLITASDAEKEAARTSFKHVTTKREHALKDLLSSERAYASDLAFIQNVHIPMALGKRAPFHPHQTATPPGSSLRTLSTPSESSSSLGHYGPPMTKGDVRIIFGNVAELGAFSDMFSERLQEALGDVLEDGKGEDWVGALLLEIIPQMQPPYMRYITKHPYALKYFNSLPRTPALANYLVQTENLASSVTHSWDLPSLLIKPTQRLPKYSLLITTIFEQTPDNHGDKENLREARDKMVEFIRAVNEGRLRIEVVKEILSLKTDVRNPAALQKELSIGKSNQGGLGRMKSISMGLRASRPKEENDEEAARVAEHERELRRCEAFVREFSSDILWWTMNVRTSQRHLREWAIDFGRTIGISEEQSSGAFDAFMDTTNTRLMALCQELEDVVANELLPMLASLLDTSKAPLRLLAVMHTLEPLHNALLDLNHSKNRPAPSLMEASQKYLALRGQLAIDLPKYLELLDKGTVMCIRQFAHRQTTFLSTVRDQWGALWDCLRMEGETNAGCVETLTLYITRYSEVDEAVSRLTILKREKPVYPRSPVRYRASDTSSMDYSSSLPHMTPLPNSPSSAFSESSSSASMRHRSIGSSDSSLVHGASPGNLRSSPLADSVQTLYSNSTPTRMKSRPRMLEGVFGRMKARLNTSPFPASVSSSVAAAMASLSQHSFNAHGMHPSTSTAIATTATYVNSTHGYAESIDSRSGEVRGRKLQSSSLSQNLNASAPPVPLPLDIKPPPNCPSMYCVETKHPCSPPAGAIYMDLPFLTLREGDLLDVLSELGHPEQFEGLCLDLEEGEEDCLLVVRNGEGEIGLALASFLVPVT